MWCSPRNHDCFVTVLVNFSPNTGSLPSSPGCLELSFYLCAHVEKDKRKKSGDYAEEIKKEKKKEPKGVIKTLHLKTSKDTRAADK